MKHVARSIKTLWILALGLAIAAPSSALAKVSSVPTVTWIQLSKPDYNKRLALMLAREKNLVIESLPLGDASITTEFLIESYHGKPSELESAITALSVDASNPTLDDHFIQAIPKHDKNFAIDTDSSPDFTEYKHLRRESFYGMQMRLNSDHFAAEDKNGPTRDFRIFGGYLIHRFDDYNPNEFEADSPMIGVSYWMAIGRSR